MSFSLLFVPHNTWRSCWIHYFASVSFHAPFLFRSFCCFTNASLMGPEGLWAYAISSHVNKPSTHHNIHTFFSLSVFLLCIFLLPGTERMSGIQASMANILEILWEQPYCFPSSSLIAPRQQFTDDLIWISFFSGLEFSQRTKTGLSYRYDGCVRSKLEMLAKLKMMTQNVRFCVCVCTLMLSV